MFNSNNSQIIIYIIMQEQSQCKLFGVVGVIVQIMLGVLSFAVLVFKRFKQQPKRPWRIWVMDTSKQAISQTIAHFLNVAISLKLSNKQDTSDPCLWYLVTIILDTTLGMLICILILRLLELTLLQGPRAKYQSGNYYEIYYTNEQAYTTYNHSENKEKRMQPLEISKKRRIIDINYITWAIQFLIWNVIVISMKSVLFVIQDLASKPLMKMAWFLLGWITDYPNFELVIVMFIVPVIMNALAFWIQDNYLMKKVKVNKQETSLISEPVGSEKKSKGQEPLLSNQQQIEFTASNSKYDLKL